MLPHVKAGTELETVMRAMLGRRPGTVPGESPEPSPAETAAADVRWMRFLLGSPADHRGGGMPETRERSDGDR